MNIQEYYRRRQELIEHQVKYRNLCSVCLQPEFGCYCKELRRFDPKIKFVILIHPIEVKRRIATGRMSHLCLENSVLIKGQDYTANDQVNEILKNASCQSVVLYPGPKALNLSHVSAIEKKQILIPPKKLVVFVIDGTWATARRMIRQSQNLNVLPRICFTPRRLSQFRVRKQPAPECLSTIEAIHHLIEHLGPAVGFDLESREHDQLMVVFDKMVQRQLVFIQESYDNPKSTSYRRPRFRVS
ncbi:MAG: DTW domain-containing protein [Bdellovibrionaceae bacterium]|nr:DTW domain-containing protein [Pseudobdellovibrionaceae bacterium]